MPVVAVIGLIFAEIVKNSDRHGDGRPAIEYTQSKNYTYTVEGMTFER